MKENPLNWTTFEFGALLILNEINRTLKENLYKEMDFINAARGCLFLRREFIVTTNSIKTLCSSKLKKQND